LCGISIIKIFLVQNSQIRGAEIKNMNKKSIIVTICFLLIVGAFVALGYIYNTDLKQENLALQNKVGYMQKEIDSQKSSLVNQSVVKNVATSTTENISTSTVGQLNISGSVKDVPADWGSVLSTEKVTSSEDVYVVKYANHVSGIYQVGVNKIYFIKKTGSGLCSKYVVGPDGYADGEICSLFSDGFYDFGSKKTLELSKNNIGDESEINNSLFLFANENNSHNQAFSPSGKYYYLASTAYESCNGALVDTVSGESYGDVGCEAAIFFGANEKEFVMRSNYAGMASPLSSFFVINPELKISDEILLLIAREKNPSLSEEDQSWADDNFDVEKDVKMISLDDKIASFEVLKNDSKYINSGKFEYNYITKKLTRLGLK
jgi:hypothetical protein